MIVTSPVVDLHHHSRDRSWCLVKRLESRNRRRDESAQGDLGGAPWPAEHAEREPLGVGSQRYIRVSFHVGMSRWPVTGTRIRCPLSAVYRPPSNVYYPMPTTQCPPPNVHRHMSTVPRPLPNVQHPKSETHPPETKHRCNVQSPSVSFPANKDRTGITGPSDSVRSWTGGVAAGKWA